MTYKRSVPALVIALLTVGCSHVKSYGPFVRQIDVVGNILVVEKCRFTLDGDDMSLDTDSCIIERKSLPGIPPDKPSHEQVLAVITPLRTELRGCGLRHSIEGVARVRLVIGPHGNVTAATADVGSTEFMGCIRRLFASRRFPRSIEGATVTYPITIPRAVSPEPNIPAHCDEPLRRARAETDPQRRYEILRRIPHECVAPNQN
jgi:hypothetical protein